MEELRRPIGPEHTEVITPDGTHQVEIAPAGSCINFMQPHGGWAECDPAAVETLTGSSGRSRSVFTRMPLTVGVRTDADEAEIVTLRLSNDPSKDSEIAFTLKLIEDDGAAQTVDLTEHVVDGQIVNKGGQVVDVVDASTLRLLTPYRAGIKSRKVIYSVTVPEGYAIVQGETWPEIHDRNGYLRSLRAVLLDKDMQPVMDGAEMPRPLNAIALSVTENGTDESGRPRYTLTKTSKIDLTSVEWAWFDVEVTAVNFSSETIINAAKAPWATIHDSSTGSGSSNNILAKCKVWSGSEQRFRWIGRSFLTFDLTNYTSLPVEMYMSLSVDIADDTDDGSFVVQKGTQPPSSASTNLNWFSLFDNSSVYCTSLISSRANVITMDKLDLAAFKNNGNYTTLCIRSKNDYNNYEPTTLDKWFGIDASGNAESVKPKLILVYPHSGPSKQLYFNEPLKPASGRVQFPIRITRADVNGAAVLDGLLNKTTANDLHFRKADGTLIPAFSRTVTKDANNAITQLDYRLSADAADLSGVKLCYGDPADSDFAVDIAQITGATVAQAEANPLPGTFWSWAELDNIPDIFMLRPGVHPIVSEILGVTIK